MNPIRLFQLRSDRPVPTALQRHAHRVHGGERWTISAVTRERGADQLGGRGNAPEVAIADGLIDDARKRLHFSWAARVSEPLPDGVRDEALLHLLARPDLELEYLGRGRPRSDRHLPSAAEILSLDILGGRRAYLFRRLHARADDASERIRRLETQFAAWKHWMVDPGARVIISLGGGGFRLFAAATALKVVDALLAGDRTQIAEVWGASGGALLGHLFASGFRTSVIDEFGYDLYGGRCPELVDGSVTSLARDHARRIAGRLTRRTVEPPMLGWLDNLERRQPSAGRKPPIPFYALATSLDRHATYALTSPDFAQGDHELIIPCDIRRGVAASTTIPFMLPAVTGIGPRADERWVDGSVIDENPLALPFLKWIRDRQRDPARTPDKLKVLLVHLNLRTSEVGALRALQGTAAAPLLSGLATASRFIDVTLDAKTETTLKLMSAHPGVEILCAKLNLGWLSLQGPSDIASAIRSGRTLEAWEFTSYAGGALARM